jgi:hypothetical protein
MPRGARRISAARRPTRPSREVVPAKAKKPAADRANGPLAIDQPGGRINRAAKPSAPKNQADVGAPGATVAPAGPRHAPAPIRPPTATPEAALRRFGSWRILGTDSVGKRAVARCDRCALVRELSLEALEQGSIPLCDCQARPAGIAADRSFAADVTRLEGADAVYRRKAPR